MIARITLALVVAFGMVAATLRADQGVVLRYRLEPGQVLRYTSEHDLIVESTVSGTTYKFISHSVALREWRVREVDQGGQARVTMTMIRVRIETTRPDGIKRTFDTEEGTAPPELADMVGKPLIELTLAPNGQVRDIRQLESGGAAQFLPYVKTVLCPFPAGSVEPGASWQEKIRLPLPPGYDVEVQIQRDFRLEGVRKNIAAIQVHTTPSEQIEDKGILARLAQFLPAGRFHFDLNEGVLRSQEMKLNQTVSGFAGQDSVMRVTGQYREQLTGEN